MLRPALAAVLLAAASPALAQSILYQNNFESGTLGSEWSTGSRIDATAPAFSKFNGRYANGGTTLTLTQPNSGIVGRQNLPSNPPPAPPPGGGSQYYLYSLVFDFYCIDSWDGNLTVNGPDYFDVRINNTLQFHETFANHGATQTFRQPDELGRSFGFSYWWDTIYRGVRLDFTVPVGDPITINFRGVGLQDIDDESWGIDNVSVSYMAVPAPGLAAAAGLVMLRRPRRR